MNITEKNTGNNNGNEFVAFFKDLSRESVARAGGKGAQLGEMFNNGISVPEGFVVLTASFDKFTNDSEIDAEIYKLIEEVDENNINAVNELSEKIRDMVFDAEIPSEIESKIKGSFIELNAEFVAVRSSATAEDAAEASWAGELETYTNVKEESLIEAVKKCWASLFTPRAIVYRIENKLRHEEVSVAVVIQKMVQSEVAGVSFTVNPISKDNNKMMIEAGFGLGEAVVSGEITPDNYIVDKEEEYIENIQVNKQEFMYARTGNGTEKLPVPEDEQEKQKLEGKQIMELAGICMNIEKHYQSPQDIEWALEKGKFYIVQTRPITTLGK